MAKTKRRPDERISPEKDALKELFMTFIEGQQLLYDFLKDYRLTDTVLDKKYDEQKLKAAIESILGWSVVHLLKSDRSISKTDLQTDIFEFIDALKYAPRQTGVTLMDGEGAGKGDDSRPFNKKVWDENFDKIFKPREPEDFQKDRPEIKEIIHTKPKDTI